MGLCESKDGKGKKNFSKKHYDVRESANPRPKGPHAAPPHPNDNNNTWPVQANSLADPRAPHMPPPEVNLMQLGGVDSFRERGGYDNRRYDFDEAKPQHTRQSEGRPADLEYQRFYDEDSLRRSGGDWISDIKKAVEVEQHQQRRSENVFYQ